MTKVQAGPPILSVRELSIHFRTPAGEVTAVDKVSFDLFPGETMALVGESGSGKSATALGLLGLVADAGGRATGGVLFEGTDLLDVRSSHLRSLRGPGLSIVFQDPLSSLNPVIRVGSQIAEMFRHHRGASRGEARDLAVDLMHRVGIPGAAKRANDFPHQFSGGMRQRIAIAIAIALEPKVLIADEPTTALDVTVQAQILELLKELQADQGMSMIMITHDLGVVGNVADRVAVMYAGRLVETGSLREVYDNPAHPYTNGLMGSIPGTGAGQVRLAPIVGSPPDIRDLPTGCRFHPRCPFAQELCVREAPPLQVGAERSSTHAAACHFSDEIASQLEARSL